jgi:hypothetical protein
MKRALDEGLSAAEAARRALAQERSSKDALDDARERFVGARRRMTKLRCTRSSTRR